MFFLVEIQKPDWNKNLCLGFISIWTTNGPMEMGKSYFVNREIGKANAIMPLCLHYLLTYLRTYSMEQSPT